MNRFLIILSVVLLCACQSRHAQSDMSERCDTVRLKYASNLSIIKHSGYTEVRLADPWNEGKTLHTYLLVPADSAMPANMPEGAIVRTPVKRAVMATSVHCSLVIDMGRKDNIAGVCEPQYIHIPFIKQQLAAGAIADCGSGMAPTIEKIIDRRADVIFLSPFQNSGGYGKVEELGIPIIETADYMETSALGRAEWMRFYGMIFGSEDKADSIFSDVERKYNDLRRLAHSAQQKRSLIMDKQTGAVWYVPGGQSSVGRIIADANIGYAWSDDEHSGSLSLPFESVLEKAGDADIWLFRYNSPKPMTRAALLSENGGYRQFRAFATGMVYGCNTAISTFYEETPFHPHLLLRDFICIAHPELNLGQPKYFILLNE